MARALSSRRGRKAADEWAEPPGEQRQEISNAKARADTIRMAAREQARMEAEIKALNADLREFKTTHIKGDLGYKLADWNVVYRVSQLESEDRDKQLDTLREGFEALSIGQTLDWVAAHQGQPQPNGAAAPARRRGAKAAADTPPHAPGHAGNGAEGEGELVREMRPGAGAAPKRGRGRPRKESPQQPGLSIVEGTGGDAAAD